MSAIKNIVTAFFRDGIRPVPSPYPALDYANGIRLTATSASQSTAVPDGLYMIVAETDDVYMKIGSGAQTADGSAAGTRFVPKNVPFFETVTGGSQQAGRIRKTNDAVLWLIPAKTE